MRHDVVKYYDIEAVEVTNANIAHDHGFVGNHPRDLAPQINRFRQVMDETCR